MNVMKNKNYISFVLTLLLIILLIHTVFSQEYRQPVNEPYGDNISSLAMNADGHLFNSTCNAKLFRSTDTDEQH